MFLVSLILNITVAGDDEFSVADYMVIFVLKNIVKTQIEYTLHYSWFRQAHQSNDLITSIFPFSFSFALLLVPTAGVCGWHRCA